MGKVAPNASIADPFPRKFLRLMFSAFESLADPFDGSCSLSFAMTTRLSVNGFKISPNPHGLAACKLAALLPDFVFNRHIN
jgi:hypothetical protein